MKRTYIESVFDHINSIPQIESHYVRLDSEREFIYGELTIASTHRHYCDQQKSAEKEAVPHSKYAEIFNYELNIGFYFPQKGQCDLCPR